MMQGALIILFCFVCLFCLFVCVCIIELNTSEECCLALGVKISVPLKDLIAVTVSQAHASTTPERTGTGTREQSKP